MTNSERRDAMAAGLGAIEGGEEASSARTDSGRAAMVSHHVRQRIADAESALVRLRNEANSRRYRDDEEEKALVKLLDDVGSPLAYLMGYVEAVERRGG